MNDLGKQICRCIVGACDDTCRHYDTEKSCCVGYGEVVQQAEKAFAEYENYKDLEEQGKLLKLPCAVGDTVYAFNMSKVIEFEVIKISRFTMDRKNIINVECLNTDLDCFRNFVFEEFDKTVFLTREEAEAALKELEDKEI